MMIIARSNYVLSLVVALLCIPYVLCAEVVPCAKIPATNIINQALLNQIPTNGAFFRKDLAAAAEEFCIGIEIPEHSLRSPVWPEIQTPGITSIDWAEGSFWKIDVAVLRVSGLQVNDVVQKGAMEQAQWPVLRISMLMSVSCVRSAETYPNTEDKHARTAVMVVPFEATVWRDTKKAYHYADLKVSLKRLAVSVTTSEQAH